MPPTDSRLNAGNSLASFAEAVAVNMQLSPAKVAGTIVRCNRRIREPDGPGDGLSSRSFAGSILRTHSFAPFSQRGPYRPLTLGCESCAIVGYAGSRLLFGKLAPVGTKAVAEDRLRCAQIGRADLRDALAIGSLPEGSLRERDRFHEDSETHRRVRAWALG
jgi:hypothetical protein